MRDRIALGLVVVVVMSLVARAAFAVDTAYVNNKRGADGERAPTVLWDSETSLRDCVDSIVARVQRQIQAIQAGQGLPYAGGDLMPQDQCASGQLGNLTQGTPVEIMPANEECGTLAKVRVVAGKHRDHVGCMQGDLLSTDRVP